MHTKKTMTPDYSDQKRATVNFASVIPVYLNDRIAERNSSNETILPSYKCTFSFKSLGEKLNNLIFFF